MALLAIIVSLASLPFKKNGAMRGPVAQMNTVVKPLISTNPKNFGLASFGLDQQPNKYQIMNRPIKGFKKSIFISLADST